MNCHRYVAKMSRAAGASIILMFEHVELCGTSIVASFLGDSCRILFTGCNGDVRALLTMVVGVLPTDHLQKHLLC